MTIYFDSKLSVFAKAFFVSRTDFFRRYMWKVLKYILVMNVFLFAVNCKYLVLYKGRVIQLYVIFVLDLVSSFGVSF